MSSRVIFLSLFAVATVVPGCSPPSAEFAENENLDDLIREAREPVQETMLESFGTPNEMVAWLKLPVDYGRIEGVVERTDEGDFSHFTASLTGPDGQAIEVDPQRLVGAALDWKTGDLETLAYQDPDTEQTAYINAFVTGFDPDSGKLTVRYSPRPSEEDGLQTKVGDEFTIIGHNFMYGRRLYMTHCVHCHGVAGDGAGPTAEYLNPRPRDYRQGVFKFTSTTSADKIRRDDLSRTIKQGIPGTYMPSFMLLEDDELHAIIEYVRWLAMRGEIENALITELSIDYSREAIDQREESGEDEQTIIDAGLKPYLNEQFPQFVGDTAEAFASTWMQAEQESSIVFPKIARTDDTNESRRRGRELYLSDKAKCASCHGPTGLGNGPQTESLQTIPGTSEKYDEPGLFDTWDNKIQPRNLTKGLYRGGRRPLDIYRRIAAGIKGTPMPAFNTALTDEEIWDIVNYVMSIPYEGSSPEVEGVEQEMPQVAAGGE